MNTGIHNTRARSEAAARFIREKSRAGQLAPAEAAVDEASADREERRNEAGRGKDAQMDLLRVILEENEDIREVVSGTGTKHYYSTAFMTEKYADMLLKKEENPVGLIADLVRENASRYPRPTPVDVLKGFPFEMTQEEILACLQNLTAREEYKDIERLSTSAGTVFLYSTRHLDPAHASLLAEWIDVGQFENP